jgi:hypothetical protein
MPRIPLPMQKSINLQTKKFKILGLCPATQKAQQLIIENESTQKAINSQVEQYINKTRNNEFKTIH